MEGYTTTIRFTSKELSPKERVAIKQSSDAISLDEATKNGNVEFTPAFYAILDIHNENGEDKDYTKYVVVDIDGKKYVTGSKSFFTAFEEIFTEMNGETDYKIVVFRKPSKNYKGKEFLSCGII